MIDPKCFSKDWIMSHRSTYPKADPLLLEKTIYAFELLGLLIKTGIPFSFKGGTALMLHFPQIFRLSIDIDVIGTFKEDDLGREIESSVFDLFKQDIRAESPIPKRHYEFYYESGITGKVDHVLLDVLDSKNPYENFIRKRIDLPFLY